MEKEKWMDTGGSVDEAPSTQDGGPHTEGQPEPPQSSHQATAPRFATPEDPFEMEIKFNGSAREYFRIWIVNLCMTLVTFGVFSAWAKVRKKRYTYSHTTLGGTPFQYLGQPIPIFKGRVIAVFGFGVYYLSSHFFTSLLPYVLGLGFIVAPWVLTRSAAFNARYSAYRNMTFFFDAGYWDAFKALYAWGLLPLLGVAMVISSPEKPWAWLIGSVVFGFYFPWWLRRIKDFTVKHTAYGGKKGLFYATGGQFFKIYFVSGLIVMAVSIPASILAVTLRSAITQQWMLTWMILAPIYAGYVMAFAYVKARSGNLVWNNIRVGPVRFQSTMKGFDLIKLYVTNAIGIVFSLGLLIPWAVIRMQTYRIDHLEVIQTDTLYQFKGGQKASVAAFGAETIDVFDMDLSL